MIKLFVVCACTVMVTPIAMAQDGASALVPIPENLKRFHDVRPAIPIGSLQSWIVTEGGKQRVAITTSDGFAVVGDVIGPGGQDLSSALLAIAGLAAPASSSAGATGPANAPKVASAMPALPSTALPSAPAGASPVQMAAPSVASTASSVPPATYSPVPIVAPTASAAPPVTLAKAQSLEELFQQATDFSAWFSAGTPKPGAPAIYFMADPTCPHCAVAIDMLAAKVKAGDIDLRVILTPIRSQQAVYEAASMLQSPNVAADFLSHELSKTTSTPSTLKVLAPTEIKADVVRALQRNVEWARANGVEGVPFWIYNTTEGIKVDFGEVKDAMLSSALTARGSAQTLAQRSQP